MGHLGRDGEPTHAVRALGGTAKQVGKVMKQRKTCIEKSRSAATKSKYNYQRGN